MFAVVIDPIVCKSAYWYFFPECWGIAVCAGSALTAFGLAALRRMPIRRSAVR
jgi:hypothetical protein